MSSFSWAAEDKGQPTPKVAASPTVLPEVTVTGTREEALLSETPASVGVIQGETVRQDKPAHPTQIMGQIPGVSVAVTNGEGHTTAIRQPFTTAPLYLFLEDGIPTRSTGFFNHNALYEINIPQSGGIEVIRGPGTALYGSDAIGGVINVLTRKPPDKAEFTLSGELGMFGWGRILAGGGNTFGRDGFRADLNLTHTDGWRDATAYDRQSGTLRWDRAIDALLSRRQHGPARLVHAEFRPHPVQRAKQVFRGHGEMAHRLSADDAGAAHREGGRGREPRRPEGERRTMQCSTT